MQSESLIQIDGILAEGRDLERIEHDRKKNTSVIFGPPRLPNDIAFSGERKRVRCSALLGPTLPGGFRDALLNKDVGWVLGQIGEPLGHVGDEENDLA